MDITKITRLVHDLHFKTDGFHCNRPLVDVLMDSKAKQDDKGLVMQLKDLLEKCLELDPARRISPKDCMQHAFVRT